MALRIAGDTLLALQPFSHSTEAAEVDSLFSSILQGAPSANMLTISGTDITSSSAPDEGRSDRADLQQSESYESHSEHEHPRSSPEHSVQTLVSLASSASAWQVHESFCTVHWM